MIIPIVSLLIVISLGTISGFFIIKKSRLLGLIFLIFTVVGGIFGTINHYKTNEELENIKKYSYVARLYQTGAEIKAGRSLTFSSPLYDLLKDTYETTEDEFHFKCGPYTYDKFEEAIKLNPEFPFSYFALADCKKIRNEDGWREYAEKAKKILEITVTISGHREVHDEVLEILKEDLADN